MLPLYHAPKAFQPLFCLRALRLAHQVLTNSITALYFKASKASFATMLAPPDVDKSSIPYVWCQLVPESEPPLAQPCCNIFNVFLR